jgi:hypothetical protein
VAYVWGDSNMKEKIGEAFWQPTYRKTRETGKNRDYGGAETNGTREGKEKNNDTKNNTFRGHNLMPHPA